MPVLTYNQTEKAKRELLIRERENFTQTAKVAVLKRPGLCERAENSG